jgi:Predicted dehydrogenases and related proteins
VGEVRELHALDTLGETSPDPTLDVALHLENGMVATMRAADAGNFTLCEMDVLGSKGRVRIVDSSYRVELSRAVPSSRYTGYVELKDDDVDFGDRKDVMLHAVEDMVECLKTGATPISSGEDGVEALRIALAAHESAKTGRMIRVDSAVKTLAIHGGKPVRTKPFPAYSTIGQEEKDAVAAVMDAGVLSGFLGTWSPAFLGGKTVRSSSPTGRSISG